MTKQDWLIHILNGGKGTSHACVDDNHKYVYFDKEKQDFYYASGLKTSTAYHDINFTAYEETWFTYPMWFKHNETGTIYKYTALQICVDSDNRIFENTTPHTHKCLTQVPEPNKMIKVARYRYFNNHKHWADTLTFYRDDADYLAGNAMFKHEFIRLLETEIEVEDC